MSPSLGSISLSCFYFDLLNVVLCVLDGVGDVVGC